jgi:hypothetical protein
MSVLIESEEGDNRPILFGLDHPVRLLRNGCRVNRTSLLCAHNQRQLANAAACPQLLSVSSQSVQILALLIMNRCPVRDTRTPL